MNTARGLSGDILYICFMVPQALQLRYKHKYSPHQHCMLSDQSPGLPLCSDTGHIQASSIIFLQMYLGLKPTATTVASGGQLQSIFTVLRYIFQVSEHFEKLLFHCIPKHNIILFTPLHFLKTWLSLRCWTELILFNEPVKSVWKSY